LTGSTVGNPNLKFEKQENLRLVWVCNVQQLVDF
jgi:hypothetical protein